MGRTGFGRLARLAIGVVMVSSGLAGPGMGPASAQEPAEGPAITVTPSTGLHDGDVVDVELTGFAGEFVGVTVCPESILDGGLQPFEIVVSCGPSSDMRFVDVRTSPAVVPGGMRMREWLPTQGGLIHCGARPGACIVVVGATNDGDGDDPVAIAPIDVVPSPLTVRPTSGVAGLTVEAHVGGEPESQVTVAQCERPVGASLTASRCGPGAPVVLDEHGVGRADVVLAQTLETPTGTVDCVEDGCAIAAFAAAGGTLASQDVTVTLPEPLRVSVSPVRLHGLVDGQAVQVTVTGRPDLPVTLAQCDVGVPPNSDVEDGPCQVLADLGPAGPGTDVRRVRVAVRWQFEGADGTALTCPGDGSSPGCVLVVEGDAGGEFHARNMSFIPVTVSPSSGLLDGQAMTIGGRFGTLASAERPLVRCQGVTPVEVSDGLPIGAYDPDRCEDPEAAPVLEVGPDGTVSTTFPAAQRFRAASGTHRYCRDDCQLTAYASRPELGEVVHPLTTYAMADGSLVAAPSSGLEDGQTVTVTGRQLMPSYQGPPVWFLGTGQWSLAQCHRDVVDDHSLLAIFGSCAVLPPGLMPVPGSDLSTAVEVQARPTSILGEPVDCTASADACVLLLTRLEQDGSVSRHAAPISFGSG